MLAVNIWDFSIAFVIKLNRHAVFITSIPRDIFCFPVNILLSYWSGNEKTIAFGCNCYFWMDCCFITKSTGTSNNKHWFLSAMKCLFIIHICTICILAYAVQKIFPRVGVRQAIWILRLQEVDPRDIFEILLCIFKKFEFSRIGGPDSPPHPTIRAWNKHATCIPSNREILSVLSANGEYPLQF